MAVTIRTISAALKNLKPLHTPTLISKKKNNNNNAFFCKMSSTESPSLTHSITLPSKQSEPVHILAAPGVSSSDFWSFLFFNSYILN